MKNIFLSILCLFSYLAVAQNYNANTKPNTYRSDENPHYWKNKLPHIGYWQQDIHYVIKANIDEKTDIIDGEIELIYHNNSPDQLNFVFFHLYQNAFQPESHLSELRKKNNSKQYLYPKKNLLWTMNK